IVILGRPQFPPVEAQAWLVYLAAVAAIVSILATLRRSRAIVTWPLSIILLLLTSWLVSRWRQEALGSAYWSTLAIIAAGMVIWYCLLSRRSARGRANSFRPVAPGCASQPA